MNPPPHLTKDPRLPPDLEREIFEICALARPVTIPGLMLVAWRVKKWVEPLLFRIVCIAPRLRRPAQIDNLGLRLPFFTSDRLLHLMNERPTGLVANSVRHLYLLPPREGGEQAMLRHTTNMDAILPACIGLTTLFIAPKETEFCATLGDMYALRRLTVDASEFFKQHPEGFAHWLFRNITHLEIFSGQIGSAATWAALALVPHLTHFSFWEEAFLNGRAGAVLAACPRLQYLVFLSISPGFILSCAPACVRLAADPRFVAVIVRDSKRDWLFSALQKQDYWTRVEAFIAAKRAGSVASSGYRVTSDDLSRPPPNPL
ncbi:hypothetical protein FB451DRAFT_1293379 [Mycena latifolia]|nr:hypothetical protein FB451DRAFT_1293379 [Mycena latifolia]